MNALNPRKERLAEIAGEIDFLREQIEGADVEITATAERLGAAGARPHRAAQGAGAASSSGSAGAGRGRVRGAASGWRTWARSSTAPSRISRPPRSRRSSNGWRWRPCDATAASTTSAAPGSAPSATSWPRTTRRSCAPSWRPPRRRAAGRGHGARHRRGRRGGGRRRESAAAAERDAAEREAAVNKAWRDASTRARPAPRALRGQDRTRGDIERRIREAERLIREGHRRIPRSCWRPHGGGLRRSLEKSSELVQRRLALLGRVNLLATGEFEVVQERHDFMARELDDVRKARRDLLEVIAQVDQEITETFTSAYRDVALQFERLVKELFPGGDGRLVLTDPAEPLTSGIEIEASPGRKRVRRICLLSGGERSLTALAFLFAIFTARPSPFYLMDEVEPALDDLNLHRFLRLVDGFAQDAQVLIVTHQKRTMEIAGMMYGVSLRADPRESLEPPTSVIGSMMPDSRTSGTTTELISGANASSLLSSSATA